MKLPFHGCRILYVFKIKLVIELKKLLDHDSLIGLVVNYG